MILVTGSSGYVGSHVVKGLDAQNQKWAPLVSRNGLPWRIGDDPSDDQLRGAKYLLHFAWARWGGRRYRQDCNLESVEKLVDSCSRFGVKLVFVSSFAAIVGESRYANEKRLSEALVLSSGGAVVRPGLIWGGQEGGSFRKLRQFQATGMPLVRPRRKIYLHLTYIGDLVDFLVDIENLRAAQVLHIAHSTPLELSDLWAKIAQATAVSPRTIRVPEVMINLSLRLLDKIPGLRERSDSLRGLLVTSLSSSIELGHAGFRQYEVSRLDTVT
jgi:nucleoside-diphosphate-sugar epimerase